MLDPLGQAWQNGSASAAMTPGRETGATINKHRLCGSLLDGADFFQVLLP